MGSSNYRIRSRLRAIYPYSLAATSLPFRILSEEPQNFGFVARTDIRMEVYMGRARNDPQLFGVWSGSKEALGVLQGCVPVYGASHDQKGCSNAADTLNRSQVSFLDMEAWLELEEQEGCEQTTKKPEPNVEAVRCSRCNRRIDGLQDQRFDLEWLLSEHGSDTT
jgi:hypothetical protein